MSPHNRRSTVLVLSLAAFLVLSGCSTVTSPGADSTPDVPTGTEAAEGYQSFDTVSATIETDVAGNPNFTDTRARVVQRPSTGEAWRKTLAPENQSGDLVVSNESVTWSYDASENEATRIDASGFENAEDTYPDYLRRLFDAVQRDGEGSSAVGVSPLPVVPGTPSPPTTTRVNGTLGQYTVEYGGTATVDGRTAHVLQLDARNENGTFVSLNQTLYLDAEHYFPLRQRQSFRYDGDVTTYTVTYENVTFDSGVAAEQFQFDPPQGTNVTETDLPESTTYESLDTLRANTSMTVPEPTLPDGFSLTTARHTVSSTSNYTTVSLTYENDSGSVYVGKHNTTDLFTGTAESENVSVGAATGQYRDVGATRMVGWACDGSYYSVSSDVLSKEELLGVARSLDCGDGDAA
ncbi:outer membrane lipoprotein carrier protein LolA [Halomarina salina]|uniref:Outer membrane lipoprotein carrier protein LolA n=1 Tax=Halomarina salina TaxID=1872699 RepID=A0ABD5RHT3_9EURY|nr:DUF4367 domain-containing protein [Halomarina salina]